MARAALILSCVVTVMASLMIDVSLHAGIVLQPDRRRFSMYDSVSLRCGEPEDAVVRNTSEDTRGRCGKDWGRLSGSWCLVRTLLPLDSGRYWCEGPAVSSDPVHIIVSDHKELTPPSEITPPPAEITPPLAEITSPHAEITPPPSSETPPRQRPLAVAVLCHLLVLCPYVLSTLLLISLHRRRSSETVRLPVAQDYDITAVTTEHDF